MQREHAKVKAQVSTLLKTPFKRPAAAEKSLENSSLDRENNSYFKENNHSQAKDSVLKEINNSLVRENASGTKNCMHLYQKRFESLERSMRINQGILSEKKQQDSQPASGLRSAEQPSFFISETFHMGSGLKTETNEEPIIVQQMQKQLLKKALFTLDLNVDHSSNDKHLYKFPTRYDSKSLKKYGPAVCLSKRGTLQNSNEELLPEKLFKTAKTIKGTKMHATAIYKDARKMMDKQHEQQKEREWNQAIFGT